MAISIYQSINFRNKAKLYLNTIQSLLPNNNTQKNGIAYLQITQLLISADPFLVNTLTNEILTSLLKKHAHHENLDEYVLLWRRMYDGTLAKKQYPNIKDILKTIKIRNQNRQLSGRFKEFMNVFQSNFNQIQEKKVQFFQDFQDSYLSESNDNQSHITDIVYLDTMEIKAIRNKVQNQSISEEALQQMLVKIKIFLQLKPNHLNKQLQIQYEKEKIWAKMFIGKHSDQLNSNKINQNISINKTFQLSKEEQEIEIVDKDIYAQRRTLQEPFLKQFSNSNKNKQKGKEKQKKYLEQEFYAEPVYIDSRQTQPHQKYFKSNNENKPNTYGLNKQYYEEDQPQNRNILQNSNKKQPQKNLIRQNRSGSRSKIFSARNSEIGKSYLRKQQKDEQIISKQDDDLSGEELIVYKYKGQPNNQPISVKKDYRATDNYFNKQLISPAIQNNQYKSQTMTKWKINDFNSPLKRVSSKKKLSDFTSEKKLRKNIAPKQQISIPDDYAVKPYSLHFDNYIQFSRFRRNCFESNFTLYASSLLIVSCSLKKSSMKSKLILEILYTNQSKILLQLQVLYKIPKCFMIQKISKINKRFKLNDSYQHTFSLDVSQFPLEACLLSLKYYPIDTNEGLQTEIPIPLTIRNFLDYLLINQDQWIDRWQKLNHPSNKMLVHLSKHLQFDQIVINSDQMQSLFKEVFVHIGCIQGYSINEYGCSCYYANFNNLQFLMRLSIRVDNIISLEITSERVVDENQIDFMEYYLQIWVMLLSKFHH